MSKPEALFLDKASLYPDDLDFSVLEEVANWHWFDNAIVSDIRQILDVSEIIVTNKVLLDKTLIESCKNLKLICVAATGVNNVDVSAAQHQAITVCNVSAYATSSVVQHVFGLLLSLTRKLSAYNESATNGDWSRSEYFCHFGEPFCDLEGKTFGIVGFGELGRSVARIAECFGMKVLIAHSHNPEVNTGSGEDRVDMATLLSSSDVISLHCPLTESNYHMIGKKELSLMRSDAILINTARGGLVDEHALLDALKNKQIAAAAIDVLDKEPPPENHELLNYRADNLIVTPHVAWASRQSRQRLVNEIAENIQAYRQGQPRNIVQ